jgi:hypothetical protein
MKDRVEKDKEFRYDSYCGIYCGSCFVMLAYTQNRDDTIPPQWNIKDAELKCHGCKSDILFENCKGCSRRPCAEEKGLDWCFQCDEYPCEIYKAASERYHLAHHEVAQQKIKILKEEGLDEWLKYQEKRWTCPNCGKIFSWYEKTCWNCGESVLDSITEEIQLKSDKKDLHL